MLPPSSQFLWCSNRGCRKRIILWICSGTCLFTQTTPSSGYYSVQTCYSAVTPPDRAVRSPSRGFGAHLSNLWNACSLYRELRLILLPVLLLIQAFLKFICNCTSLVPLLVPIKNCSIQNCLLCCGQHSKICVLSLHPCVPFPVQTRDSHGLFLLNIIDPHSHRFCLMSTNAATCTS